MTTVLLAVVVFLLVASGLAVGFLFNRRPIKGSCGGCVNCLCTRDRP